MTKIQFEDKAEVILIDKPLTWTSFDVVKKLKFAGRFKKIGHAGTLDPLATGLLVICTGKKTKEIDSYQAQIKEYTGSFVVGKTTPSVDLETDFDGEYPIEHIDNELIEAVRQTFMGEIEQVPPAHSAVKIDGKRAYELARKGLEVAIKTRVVTITKFEIDASAFPEIKFLIECTKGTYIRSIARDFGLKLNSGAYLSSLRRTKIGNFAVEDALTIERFIEKNKTNPLSEDI